MEQVRTRRAFFGPEGNFRKGEVIPLSAARTRELTDKGFVEPVKKAEVKAPVKKAAKADQ